MGRKQARQASVPSLAPVMDQQGPAVGETCLAEVTAVEAGEALRLQLEAAGAVRVAGHAAGVEALQAGDRVVAMMVEGGAVVVQRMRRPGERPRAGVRVEEDGSLYLNAPRGFRVESAHATLELRADGRVFIDGKEIYCVARGVNRLQGATIELN